jgi:hypothetical protein
MLKCCQSEREVRSLEEGEVAGEAGFEPTRHGVKVRCLTAWLLPSACHFLLYRMESKDT